MNSEISVITEGKLSYTNQVYVAASNKCIQTDEVSINNFVCKVGRIEELSTDQIAFPEHIAEFLGLSAGGIIEVNEFTRAENDPEQPLFAVRCLAKIESIQKDHHIEIEHCELENHFRKIFNGYYLGSNQTVLLNLTSHSAILSFRLEIQSQSNDDDSNESKIQEGRLESTTKLEFDSLMPSSLKIRGSQMIFKNHFKFEDLGVGGLDQQISEIFRRAFASRRFLPTMLQKLGCNHVRGLLLYGPPGTGKTLIARQLSKNLNSKEPKIVNGPELLDKFVGETERKIRDLFFEAIRDEKEFGFESPLHVIIFDEFDAICRSRGTVQNGTSVNDTAVNMLLSMIDGINSLNNILLIGMTNRKDMIDEAMLRPGRFEVHIEVSLPDEKGRLQILEIHTKQMRKNNLLADDVDLKKLAEMTPNFTGAELESLLKSAISNTLTRTYNLTNFTDQLMISDLQKIEQQDFEKALKEVKPHFGVDSNKFDAMMRGGVEDFGVQSKKNKEILLELLDQLKNGSNTQISSILIHGESGSGKSAIGAWLALEAAFPYVKLINSETLIGQTEVGKVNTIIKIFEDAYRSPYSVIMIDDIERIIELVAIGPQFSNHILQTLLTLLKKVPNKPESRLLVLGTTSRLRIMKDLEIAQAFDYTIELPILDKEELVEVLSKKGMKKEERVDGRELQNLPQLPIKQLLMIVDMVTKGGSEFTQRKFLDCYEDVRRIGLRKNFF